VTATGIAIGVVVGAIVVWLAYRLINWLVDRALIDRR
jgi:hypothetical protein